MGNPREDSNFGNGEVGGDNRWTSPVHASTEDGRDVTVSFGKNSRDGHTLISKGHVSGDRFYSSKGHDHFGPNGESYGDRSAS